MSYCNWGDASDVTQRYHDEEWGMPVRDDVKQFEYLDSRFRFQAARRLRQPCLDVEEHR